MEAADTGLGQGLGERLRRAREQRSLSLEECAERLYLPTSVLEALEGEQFAALGAGVYARGHLRRYAGLLEMDATVLEQMMLQRLAAAPDLATIVTRRVGSTRPKRRLGLLPVAIVAVLLALAVLVWWSARHVAQTQPAPVPTPVAPTSAPATGSLPVPAPPAMSSGTATPARGSRDASAPRLVVAEATPRPKPAATAAAPNAVGTTPVPRRRVAPQPQAQPGPPQPPRETQRDYTNFDF